MLAILRNPTYARLFSAQVVALLGTGLLTIALGLIAFDIAGGEAGRVLGIALTIKMLAYVGLGPFLTAAVANLPRKSVLIAADLVRAAAALCLPFIESVWQIYLLVFLLQAASATFTPTFQAVIPQIFDDEGDYTRALSLSRLAYDIENMISPVLAGLLLLVVTYSTLFVGTTIGFLASAWLVFSAALPIGDAPPQRRFFDRVTHGSRIYLATPRLRGLLALNMAVSSVGAVMIVNTVVIVRAAYGGGDTEFAMALAAAGAGSMLAALSLPRLLDQLSDRRVMLTGAVASGSLLLLAGLWVLSAGWPAWTVFLLFWFGMGAANSAIMTPTGRLLRRSAGDADRPALFAAQFALSHACWLLAYPAAGILGAEIGQAATMVLLSLVALACVVLARRLWVSVPLSRDRV